MTSIAERARSRKPVSWFTIAGVVLLPVIIGGLLVAALYNPTERLDQMNAAIVNNDEPVELDGQTVPLGRQLSAGLVEGSDDLDSNLTWTISNDEDAADGLADGTYAAVITIPENFSAAATSTTSDDPEQALIEVETSPDALIVDDAITAQVANAAASAMGTTLSETYMENVFLGFTTLNEQLGEAADGADQLADGGYQLQDGAEQLADGARDGQDGAYEIADGVSQLGDGTSQLASGIGQTADGAGQISDGLGQTASGLGTIGDGAGSLSDGLGDIAGGLGDTASGAGLLGDTVSESADELRATGLVPSDVTDVADASLGAATTAAGSTANLATTLGTLAATCDGSATYCASIADAAAAAGQAAVDAGTAQAYADGTVQAIDGFDIAATASLADGYDEIAGGVYSLQSAITQLQGGVTQSAQGAADLQTGIAQTESGVLQLQQAATQLQNGLDQSQNGAQQIATGITAAASGTDTLGDGLGQLGDGGDDLADGAGELADGTGELASGLDTAVEEIPTYTDDEAESLATVVADPVSSEGVGTDLFGASAIPLLATIALWFGGLGSYVAFAAATRRALGSRRSSATLALRGLVPGAIVGAVQGLLLAGIVQIAAEYSWSDWSVFALLCVVAGVAFAAVNQALVAVFGGAGRWISALVGVLALGTGIVSTVPGVLTQVASLLPTSPAYSAMLGALTAAGGVTTGLVALIVWSLLAFIATIIALGQRRKTSARALSEASPALL